MVHPLLFLEFFRTLLAPFHITGASADAIIYTWFVIVLLLVLSVLATKAVKTVPSGLQNFMEVVIGGIENMIVETMGEHGKPFFPFELLFRLFVVCGIGSLSNQPPGRIIGDPPKRTFAFNSVAIFVPRSVNASHKRALQGRRLRR